MTKKKIVTEKAESAKKSAEAKAAKVKKKVILAQLDNPLLVKCLKCNVTFAREVELPKNREIKCSCCKKEIKVNAGLEGG